MLGGKDAAFFLSCDIFVLVLLVCLHIAYDMRS